MRAVAADTSALRTIVRARAPVDQKQDTWPGIPQLKSKCTRLQLTKKWTGWGRWHAIDWGRTDRKMRQRPQPKKDGNMMMLGAWGASLPRLPVALPRRMAEVEGAACLFSWVLGVDAWVRACNGIPKGAGQAKEKGSEGSLDLSCNNNATTTQTAKRELSPSEFSLRKMLSRVHVGRSRCTDRGRGEATRDHTRGLAEPFLFKHCHVLLSHGWERGYRGGTPHQKT